MKIHTFKHCIVEEVWSGEYPWSSFCNFWVYDKSCTTTIAKFIIRTDINPRGETTLQRQLRWAKHYIPPTAALDETMEELEEEGHEKEELLRILKRGYEAVNFFKERRPLVLSTVDKKMNREYWRLVYKERKVWKELGRSPAHLLVYRLTGFDYLHKEVW